MERVSKDGLEYYRHEKWDTLKHGIFTRHGGVSQSYWASLNVGGTNGDDDEAVRINHQRMYNVLDVNGNRACTTWMIHGVETIIANDPPEGRRWLAKADGILTNKPDTPLVMRYADCTPLMVYDPTKQVIGLGHAGWRGTVNGMGARMVKTMYDTYDCQPEDIEVVIGAAISQENYQVGEEVVVAVNQYFGDDAELIARDVTDGTAYLDLWKANQLDFERHGVTKVEVMGICTFDNTNDFFSHRAEKGKTGRFGVVISL